MTLLEWRVNDREMAPDIDLQNMYFFCNSFRIQSIIPSNSTSVRMNLVDFIDSPFQNLEIYFRIRNISKYNSWHPRVDRPRLSLPWFHAFTEDSF